MKKVFKKAYFKFLQLIPVISGIMLITAANSTACWMKGQDELPAGVKKYRKF